MGDRHSSCLAVGRHDGSRRRAENQFFKALRHAGYSADELEDFELQREPFWRGADVALLNPNSEAKAVCRSPRIVTRSKMVMSRGIGILGFVRRDIVFALRSRKRTDKSDKSPNLSVVSVHTLGIPLISNLKKRQPRWSTRRSFQADQCSTRPVAISINFKIEFRKSSGRLGIIALNCAAFCAALLRKPHFPAKICH